MSLALLQALVTTTDPRAGLELAARLTGNPSPYEVWRPIAEARPDPATIVANEWAEQSRLLHDQAARIERALVQVGWQWTGTAADAATAYLGLLARELTGAADDAAQISQMVTAAVEIVEDSRRAIEDAERAYYVALVSAVLAFLVTIAAVAWIPAVGQGAAATLVLAALAVVGAIVMVAVGYDLQARSLRDRRNEDLGRELARLHRLIPSDPLPAVADSPAPTLSPVTTAVAIPPLPPLPALG